MSSKKDIIFYVITGTIIGWLTSIMGANLAVVLLSSLLIPPVLIIIFRILR